MFHPGVKSSTPHRLPQLIAPRRAPRSVRDYATDEIALISYKVLEFNYLILFSCLLPAGFKMLTMSFFIFQSKRLFMEKHNLVEIAVLLDWTTESMLAKE